MLKSTLRNIFLPAILLTMPAVLSAQGLSARGALPLNLGAGLRELVDLHQSRPAGMLRLDLGGKSLGLNTAGKPVLFASAKRGILADRAGRVMVTVILDGSQTLTKMKERLGALGASVVGEDPYEPDLLSVYLPLDAAAALARSPGISAVKLARRPLHHAGAVTSIGTQLIQSDQVNASGFTGRGVTVGILSDSFDTASAQPTATDDVATGDLPNMGVADGRSGLKFLSEGAGEDSGDLDEGRAMAQIVYDVAPGISLCFASADFGSVSFARNIRRLRTDSSCAADILVDDIIYLDEPMFSDGSIARAVDDVVTSDVLAGHRVAYFSAAGNEGSGGYSSDLRIVADSDARALLNSGIDLSTIPTRIDTSGGFHNFNPDAGGVPAIAQTVTLAGSDTTTIVLQWDDLFDRRISGITTDLNLLVFSNRGRYLGSFADDNFSTNEPIEIGDIPAGTYRFVIARTGRGAHDSSRVRYVAFVPSDGSLTADYVTSPQSSIYGHAAARNAHAVGAYGTVSAANSSIVLESYSAVGPATIAFDSEGNRLAEAEVRRKPDISAPDCVKTTFFFGPDSDDSFYTFCGTSAAAPHAAAAAALLLEAAGGPGSLSSDRIRAKLQASPLPRDLDPFYSSATLSSGGAQLTVSGSGDDSNTSAYSPTFFRIAFQTSTSGQMLTGLTIDLGATGLNFDPSTQTGYPFTRGAATAGITVTSPAPSTRSTILTLSFTGFASGSYLTFGLDRDLASTNVGGNSADLLAGASVTATFSNGTPATGVFANVLGTGFSIFDGFGLVNAPAALKAP